MSNTNTRVAKAREVLDRAEKMLLGNKNKQQALQIMLKCYFLH